MGGLLQSSLPVCPSPLLYLQVGSALVELGLERNERVGVFGANCPEWMLTMQVRVAVITVKKSMSHHSCLKAPFACEDCWAHRSCTLALVAGGGSAGGGTTW